MALKWTSCLFFLTAVVNCIEGQLSVTLQEPENVVTQTPVRLQLLDGSRNFTLVPGRTYAIHCESMMGFEGSTEVWLDGNGDPVLVLESDPDPPNITLYARLTSMGSTNEWSLWLRNFTENMVGTYICRRTEEERATLTIGSSNPTAIATSPDQQFISGTQIGRPTLLALVSATPDWMVGEVRWLFNGEETLPDGISQLPTELILPNHLLGEYSGVYTCIVDTSAGIASANFAVWVLSIPSPDTSITGNHNVTSGSSINIVCTDSFGFPLSDIIWTHNGEDLVSGGRVEITPREENENVRVSELIINPVQREDNGSYRCLAVNPAMMDGVQTAAVEFTVLYPPILNHTSDPSPSVITSESVVLQATLVASFPPMIEDYSWVKQTGSENITIENSQNFEISSDHLTLTVRNAMYPEQDGLYFLEAINQIGTGSVGFDVMVLVPPTFTSLSSSDVLARTGSSATLSLNIRNARPSVREIDITWLFRNSTHTQEINLADEKFSLTLISAEELSLTISDLRLEDSGSYTVNVSHPAGSREISFEVTVRDPPRPPTRPSADLIAGSQCTVRIEWMAPPPEPPSSTTASADFVIIERRSLNGRNAEWELITGGPFPVEVTSTQVVLPGSVQNENYVFRGRSGNNTVGTGSVSATSASITAYAQTSFPVVIGVLAIPLDSRSINISWTLPAPHYCFQFIGFVAKCSGMQTQASTETRNGMETFVIVSGLEADTEYVCDVSSILSDTVDSNSEFDYRPVSSNDTTQTFPAPPSPPPPPVVPEDKPPTLLTITVQFVLPSNSDRVSHYRVIVLRLNSSDSLPSGHPDTLYPLGFQFDTYENVNNPDIKEERYRPYIAAEIAAEVFNINSEFTIGAANTLDEAGFLNGKLVPQTFYTCFLRAFSRFEEDETSMSKRQVPGRQYVSFSSSDFLPAQLTTDSGTDTGSSSPNSSTTGIAAGVIIFLILVAAAILLLVLGLLVLRYRGRRRKSYNTRNPVSGSTSSIAETPKLQDPDTPDLAKRMSGVELKELESHSSNVIPSGPIPLQNFAAHVEKFDANRQLLFQEEFDWITARSPWYPSEASNDPLNDEKNRYSNITAFDHTRVKLKPVSGVECSDYINANYINGYKRAREYISCQGPLVQTVEDFWRMVWEQRATTIVMLTNLVELGKVKCTRYWPENGGGSVVHGDIELTLEHTVVLPDYTIRNLNLRSLSSGENRTVLQFHYTGWPDYGTPNLAAPLLNFLRAVHVSDPGSSGPTIIHCSAGVGRSGTVIAIDICQQQLKAEGIVDVRGCISKLREQRNYMVQTEQQYTFIHYTILEAIVYGDTSFALSNFSMSYQHLQEVDHASGRTLLEEEFNRLGTVKTMVRRSAFVQKVKPRGANGRIPYIPGDSGSLEYNAHYIDAYSKSRQFIVADGPTGDYVSKFWQMVWDEDCAYIVMLTPLDAEYLTYWPAMGDRAQHGNVIVEVESESAEHLYTVRSIRLTNAKDGISHHVQQYQFIGWTMQYLPPVPTFVSFVCDVLKGAEALEKNQRVLVHDTKSQGPSGVFCSLCFCTERLRVERMVDVFQAVQRVQLQRPGMVESMQQYAFVYDCVFEFIRTHSSS